MGLGSRSVYLRVLLLALAFQGVTPGAHDLTSIRLGDLLGPIVGGAAIRPGDGPRRGLDPGREAVASVSRLLPSDADGADATTDEAWAPARAVRTVVPRPEASHSLDPGLFASRSWKRPRRTGLRASGYPGETAGTGTGLVLALCRLTC
jgi:hypothetical protein